MPVLLVTSMCYKSISSLCKLEKCYKYVSKPYDSLSKKNASNQGREWGLIRKGIRKVRDKICIHCIRVWNVKGTKLYTL